MNFSTYARHFHLDPAADGTGGGAAAADSPVGGAAPAFDESKYVPVEKYQELEARFGETTQEYERRFQEFEGRLPKPESKEHKSDKAPSVADYDFNKEGEFERFMDDRASYLMEKKLSEREKSQSETLREQNYKQYVQSAQNSHAERADSFRAANPDYDPNRSIKIGNEAVGLAILESDFSAHIHNYLQKNPDKTKELQKLATSNPAAAIRLVGRIEAQFESQAAAVPSKMKAAAAKVTAGGFGGKGASGKPAKTLQQIYDEFNS